MMDAMASYAFRIGKAQNAQGSQRKIKQVQTRSCQKPRLNIEVLLYKKVIENQPIFSLTHHHNSL
jgi:hypothetical protein